MGKNSKSKNKRYKYTKQEFTTLCCDKCILCDPGADPSFCYGKIYIKDPKIFIKSVFKELLSFGQTLGVAGYIGNGDPDAMLKILFQETFCDSKICRGFAGSIECPEIEQCLYEFTQQLKGVGSATVNINSKGKKHKKNKRQVYEPYPTFFCNSKFEQTVKDILNNKTHEGANDGDVDIEQDKIEECACEHDGSISQSADGSESEVHGSTAGGQEHVQNISVYL